MRLVNQILLASTNREKFEEFRALLGHYPGVKLIPAHQILRNADAIGNVEKYNTYLENASAKARIANTGCHYPCLADDSGLEVDALQNRPGVKSHRFAPPKPGLTQDEANVQMLLAELRSFSHPNERSARFVCTLALLVEGVMLTATGTLEGTIADRPRGIQGFGYDPVFIPKGHDRTFAEMNSGEKNSISHRANALRVLMSRVEEHGIVFAKP